MTYTRVKICGITSIEDALSAINAGADALGFVFYEKSPRSIEAERCAEIVSKLPPFISKIGLFVNPEANYVHQVRKQVSLDYLQFHGDEPVGFCEQFSKPYLKAIRMQKSTNLAALSKTYASASGLLVDAFDESAFGGTGQKFDWAMLSQDCTLPLVLAGGLTPLNVAQAIKQVRPFAVDVSSGVEISKGVKSSPLIKQFMSEVFTCR